MVNMKILTDDRMEDDSGRWQMAPQNTGMDTTGEEEKRTSTKELADVYKRQLEKLNFIFAASLFVENNA